VQLIAYAQRFLLCAHKPPVSTSATRCVVAKSSVDNVRCNLRVAQHDGSTHANQNPVTITHGNPNWTGRACRARISSFGRRLPLQPSVHVQPIMRCWQVQRLTELKSPACELTCSVMLPMHSHLLFLLDDPYINCAAKPLCEAWLYPQRHGDTVAKVFTAIKSLPA
jgi:hypothetical protein